MFKNFIEHFSKVVLSAALLISLPAAAPEVLYSAEPDGTSMETQQIAADSVNHANRLLARRLTITATNDKLKDVLDRISAMTGAYFVYDSRLSNIKNVSLDCQDQHLQDVLDNLFSDLGIKYQLVNRNNIVLTSEKRDGKKTGSLSGIIKESSGEPLMGATVLLIENKFGAATNMEGEFMLDNLKPGEYNMKVSFMGFKSQTKKIIIYPGQVTRANFSLETETFQIGGIEVTSHSELVMPDAQTKTVISSGEIEHFQATNVGDVLSLVPGVQKTENPGLGKTGQIAIRSGDATDALSAFGTLIIVDGVPQSNNANLKFEALSGPNYGLSSMGAGADLRAIPADNLQSIEVISGLPSVRYGDFTSGIVNIKTKIGDSPNRLKIKNNPNTNEANLGGGWKLNDKNSLSYNANYARSERDARVSGDEFTRWTGQMVWSNMMMDGRLSTNYKVNGQFIRDEERPKNDYLSTNNFDRSIKAGVSSWGTYTSSDLVSSFEYNAFVSMNRVNIEKSKLVVTEPRILPNGDTSTTYIGVLKNKGMEWNAGGRLEYNTAMYTGSFFHKFMFGTDAQYNVNTGDGLIIDSVFNYYGNNAAQRSWSYDEVPGQTLLSFYAEDKITGRFFFDFSVLAGLRYEMYRPYEFNIKGLWGDGDLVKSHQGSWFNPRLSLLIYLSEKSQLRLNAGKTSKSPAMSNMYPMPAVMVWRNPDEAKNYYFSQDNNSPELKAYSETQYEVNYDQQLFNSLSFTASAYYKERGNNPTRIQLPLFYESKSSGTSKVYYLGLYEQYINYGKYINKGLEFSVKTKQIRSLNMNFQVTGSYNYTNNPGGNTVYSKNPDASLGQYPNYKVPGVSIDTTIGWTYMKSGKWNDQLQLNYCIRYTNPVLGMWITLSAEQMVRDARQTYQLAPVDKSKLTTDALLARYYEEKEYTKPVKWLFNLNVTKSLWKGAEMSFYVNNFFDDQGVYRYYSSPTILEEDSRNPSLFYGLEFSCIIDEFLK
ncbi:MAG: TonB-dependent receptor [Bacteroidota bacterium]